MRKRSVIAAIAGLALAGFALTCASAPLLAQSYPDRVIKLIVPAPPGGQTDVLARYLGQQLQTALGHNVIIDNRAGAGGAIGARAAATAEPDGYTLFFGNTSTLAVIPAVSKKAGYDPVKNYAPIASVSESYMILVVHPDFPAKTLGEFIAYAKANPGKLNFGNAGAGNVTHLTGEMLRAATGIEFVNVPHRGGAESITALLGRQVDFVLESPVVLLPLGTSHKPDSLVLRPINSVDGMTASVVRMPKDLLDRLVKELQSVQGIAGIFYDLTNKPPGTIEWE